MKLIPKNSFIFSVSLLFWLVMTILPLYYLFKTETQNIEHSFTRQYFNQAGIISDLCKRYCSEGDFESCINIVSLPPTEKIIEAFLIDNGNQVILPPKAEGFHNYINPDEKYDEDHNMYYQKYVNRKTGLPVFRVCTPIKKKELGCLNENHLELITNFDMTALVERINNLERKFIIVGILLFLLGGILIVLSGRMIANRYLNIVKIINKRAKLDPFALPAVNFDTCLSVTKGSRVNKKILPAEKQIVKIVGSGKRLRDIIERSPLHDWLTFEIASKLVMLEILEINAKED